MPREDFLSELAQDPSDLHNKIQQEMIALRRLIEEGPARASNMAAAVVQLNAEITEAPAKLKALAQKVRQLTGTAVGEDITPLSLVRWLNSHKAENVGSIASIADTIVKFAEAL